MNNSLRTSALFLFLATYGYFANAQAMDALCLEAVSNITTDYQLLAFLPSPDTRALSASLNGTISLLSFDGNIMVNEGTYLLISGVDSDSGGLLGIAVHPDWNQNGKFYVSYAPNVGSLVISEYQAMAGDSKSRVADPNESKRIVSFKRMSNSTAAFLQFGQDGYLYIFVGIGDDSSDAQNLTKWSGKIHRVDVNSKRATDNFGIPNDNPFYGQDGVLPSIFASGFQNPFRNSFDRKTGRIFVADVGKNVQEVNVLNTPPLGGGRNFGYRKYEGSQVNPLFTNDPIQISAVQFPQIEYNRSQLSGNSNSFIIGGYQYRGSEDGCNYGRYIFADASGVFFSAISQDDYNWTFKKIEWKCAKDSHFSCGDIESVNSFAEDNNGDLYIISKNVWKVVDPSRCDAIACSTPIVTNLHSSGYQATNSQSTQHITYRGDENGGSRFKITWLFVSLLFSFSFML